MTIVMRDVADMVEYADCDHPDHWQWEACERCCGRVAVVKQVYGEDILVMCEDCGLFTCVVDAV